MHCIRRLRMLVCASLRDDVITGSFAGQASSGVTCHSPAFNPAAQALQTLTVHGAEAQRLQQAL